MTILTEGKHAGGFLVSEGNVGSDGVPSGRDAIAVKSGQNLVAGAVIAAIFAGTATATAAAGNVGNGAFGAITVTGSAQTGAYTLTVIETEANVGAFTMQAPDGSNLATGDVASAYSDGGLAFTLADGATDFTAGDVFVIAVVESGTEYVEYNPAGTDGSENVAGLLFDNCDATNAAVDAVMCARETRYSAVELTWKTGMSAGEIAIAQNSLAKLGIIAR